MTAPAWVLGNPTTRAKFATGTGRAGKAATAALADAARATGDERAQHLNTIAELLDRADTVAAEAGTWPLRAPALEATP